MFFISLDSCELFSQSVLRKRAKAETARTDVGGARWPLGRVGVLGAGPWLRFTDYGSPNEARAGGAGAGPPRDTRSPPESPRTLF